LVDGRYRIETVVAAGANTVITEAIDVSLNRPVTLKVVRPHLAVTTAFRQAFRRRIEVAMTLAHPNIATVLGWGELDFAGDPTVYWVVEYLGGGSLRDLFDRGRLLAPSQALVVGLEATRALEAAHQRGVVHTEITPSKLVFGEDGRLRITDVVMSQLLGAEAWMEPATVATHVARYASPEQALGSEVDAKTDVYSLSLCLIEAITGNVPFAGDSTVSTLAARVGKLMPVTADMGSLASVLERGGRPDPEDRWSAAEFGTALVQAAGALPRPEPIPVLATSLFASSLAHRAAAAAPKPEPIADPEPEPEPAPEPEAEAEAAPESAAEPEPELIEEPEPELAAEPEPELVEEPEPVPGPLPEPESAPAPDPAPDAAPDDGHHDQDDDGVATPTALAAPLLVIADLAGPPASAAQPPVGAPSPVPPPPAPPVTSETPATVEMSTAPAPDTSVSAATALFIQPDAAAVEPAGSSGTLYDEDAPRRPWGKYLAFALVVLIGIALLSWAGWLLLRTKSYEVPDLTGIDEAVARNEISDNGWTIEIERERSDDVPEIDHVIRTVPVPGEMLDEGATFVMVVSDGFEFRTLPDVVGEPLDEARATLADLLLVPLDQEGEFSEDVAEGSVVRWQVQDDASLAAGAQVLPDTVVELVPSLGPEPRPAPDLANLTAAEATAALEELQLVGEQGEDVFSDDIEVGRVVSQVPSPTTAVERGGTVTFRLSKGPDLVTMPDLTGLGFAEADAALTEAGFTLSTVLGSSQGTFVSVSVDGEAVAAGDRFERGTGVDLVFL
jgi:serine/threonine-protein kinase